MALVRSISDRLSRLQVATVSLGGPTVLCFHKLEDDGCAGASEFEVC